MLWDKDVKIWLYCQITDMRKSYNGLSQLVLDELRRSPDSGELFIFFNRVKDKVKILYWHYNGFCLLQKRLEKDSFKIPKDLNKSITLSSQQLYRLLEGLHFTNTASGIEKLYY